MHFMQNIPDYNGGSPRRIIFHNTSAIVLGRIVNLLFSITSSVLIVRYLGSARFGQYAFIYAYLVLFGWLTTLSMEQIIVRESAQQRAEKIEFIVSTAMTLSFFLSLAAAAFAIFMSFISRYTGGLQMLVAIAAIDVLLLAPLRLSSIVFQIYLKQWYVIYISIARQGAWVIILMLLIMAKAGLSLFIVAHLLCSFLEALMFFLFSRKLVPIKWYFDSSIAYRMLKGAWPIALSAVGVSVYQRIDQVMLHILKGDQELGYYAAAVNIVELFGVFPAALMFTMLPLLSEVFAQNRKEQFEAYIKICLRYLMSFLFGVCVVLTLIPGVTVKLFFGGKYLNSIPALSVLIWSEAGVFLGLIIGVALIAKRLERFIPVSAIGIACVNIMLNALWIPRWGIIGAAWATVVSYSVVGFLLFGVIPATRDLWILGAKASYVPLLMGLLLVSVSWAVPTPFFSALAPFLYIGGLFACRIWNKDDIRLMLSLFTRGAQTPL
jgi:O-antigen/teichoic acid export membrane protein